LIAIRLSDKCFFIKMKFCYFLYHGAIIMVLSCLSLKFQPLMLWYIYIFKLNILVFNNILDENLGSSALSGCIKDIHIS
jgi:hypothetical protein